MDVCGFKLQVISKLRDGKGNVIMPIIAEDVVTLGLTALGNDLDLEALEGQWESTLIQQTDATPGQIDKILVIAGSDVMGVIYGLYEVSEKAFGTDPQKYWTDASPSPTFRVI